MIRLLLLLIVFAVSIWLQVVLSKMSSRLPGLILPGLAFLLSLTFFFSIPAYNTVSTESITYSEEGDVIATESYEKGSAPRIQMIIQVVMVFLYANISTVIYLIIYWVVRKGRKRDQGKGPDNDEMTQMKLQDL